MALRENLELDIAEALRGVDRVEAQLSQAAQGFKVQLAEALTALSVTVDVSGVSDTISGAVESADSTVVVEGEAEAVTGSIDDAVGSADSTVLIDGDAEPALAAIEGLSGESVEVTVDADTAAAQAQIDELAGSVEGLGAQAQESSVGVDDLGGAAGGLGGRVNGAAVGAAALAAGVVTLFNAATDAEGSLQSFNLRTGEFAAQVRLIDVGGLNEDLGVLALRLGSSDEAAQDAAARIFELGTASGVAAPEVAETTNQIIALAARAVALNPTLGDVGAVAETMTGALARGGRTTAAFGIALTAADIEARALADTGKATAAELTIYEKSAAGAALASEQFGTAIADDVNAGAANAQIQVRSLGERFGELTETIGAPIVKPGIAILGVFVDGLTLTLGAVTEAAGMLFDKLGLIPAALAPIGRAIDTILGPLDEFAGKITGVFDTVLGPVDETISGLFSAGDASFDLAAAADVAAASLGGQAASLVEVAGALSFTGGAFNDYIASQSQFSQNQDVEDALQRTGILFTELRGQLQDASGGYADFVAASAAAGELTLEIDGVEQTSEQILALGDGLRKMVFDGDAAITSGEDLAEAFDEEQRAAEAAAESQAAYLVQSGEVTQAQFDQAIALSNASAAGGSFQGVLALLSTDLAAVDAGLAATNASLAAQAPAAGLNAQSWVNLSAAILAGQVTSTGYQGVADQLGVSLEQVTGFADGVTGALDAFVSAGVSGLPTISGAFVDLNEDSKVSLAEFRKTLDEQTASIAEFPNTVRTLLAFGFDDMAALAIERGPEFAAQLAADLRAGGPDVASATEASLEGFRTETAEAEAFLRNEAGPALLSATTEMAEGAAAGFEAPLNFGGATADQVGLAEQALVSGTPDVVALAAFAGVSVEEAYAALDLKAPTDAAMAGAAGAINAGAPSLTGAAGTAGTRTAAGFQSGADFAGGIRSNLNAGSVALAGQTIALIVSATSAGRSVGVAFDSGIAAGIASNLGVVREAGRSAVRAAEASARAEAGIASPSKLFADAVGAPIAAGVAAGIEGGSGVVAGAARRVVAAGAVAAGGASGAVGGGVEIGSIDVSVVVHGSMSDQQAKATGAALGDSIADRLEDRRIAVDVRTL